ncbi:MAG TPA: hypothetical protein VIJ51_02075 [Solirubrobacteraceae bacterium]
MQIDTLSRLVRESRYPLDDNAIAEAILARITMPVLTPPLRRSRRRRSVRSFHPARHVSSFHLVRPPRRAVARPAAWPA